MPFPNPIRAVLIDMDGTLLDTEQVYVGAMFSAVAAMGFTVDEPVAHALVGLPGKECIDLLRSNLGESFDTKQFHQTFLAHRAIRLETGVPLKPGVFELLDHLAASGLPHAVATSSNRRNAEDALGRAGLLSRFSAVLTRDDVAVTKPHPDLFLKAAEAVGIAPEFCVAIEDSHVGVRSAHAAGTMPVMVPDLLVATDEIRGLCVAVVPDLHAVRALLSRG